MDEEGKLQPCSHLVNKLIVEMSSIATAKHAEFVKARGRHYSNEAEAMKVCILYNSPELGRF